MLLLLLELRRVPLVLILRLCHKWADITHSGNAEFGCMTNSESIVAPRTDPNNHKIILARVGRWGGCSKRVYGIA